MADYDLVIASQPYRARASVEFKASKVVTPLVRALRPGGRLIGIHSHGHDPGIEIIDQVWPGDDPFKTDRYAILRQVKHELGAAARHYNFNASSDARSIFRYHMHTLPDEVSGPIGTSTLFAAWNAAIYVAQIEDVRLSEVVRDGRYLEATDRVLKKHGGLWFNDETYVISRRRCRPSLIFFRSCPDCIRSCFIRPSRGTAWRRPRSRSPRAAINCRSCGIISQPGTDVTITFLPGDNYRHNVETAAALRPRRLQSGAPYRRARNRLARGARRFSVAGARGGRRQRACS